MCRFSVIIAILVQEYISLACDRGCEEVSFIRDLNGSNDRVIFSADKFIYNMYTIRIRTVLLYSMCIYKYITVWL